MMAFFLTPIGRWLAGIAVAGLVGGGLYLWGHINGNLACITKNAEQVTKMEKWVKDLRSRIEHRESITPDLLRDDPFIRPGE